MNRGQVIAALHEGIATGVSDFHAWTRGEYLGDWGVESVLTSACARALAEKSVLVGSPKALSIEQTFQGIMDYSQRPDYARVVDITTRAALREMIVPGLVAVSFPIIIGVVLGYEAVAGMLMVGTISGVMLATVLNNSGGAWDNAKKYIESGHLTDELGNVLGKKTEAHAAAVVGDTVGDPFKDTAGPSLHVLVKLLATVTLVMAPLFIR